MPRPLPHRFLATSMAEQRPEPPRPSLGVFAGILLAVLGSTGCGRSDSVIGDSNGMTREDYERMVEEDMKQYEDAAPMQPGEP